MNCNYCGNEFKCDANRLNRAKKMGLNLYCSKKCSGLGRRCNKTVEQKKAEKKIYDQQYRLKNFEYRKKQKHEYFKRTYDPVKAAIERKKRMPKHVEYCRRPEYRKKKQEYDLKRRAKLNYGEFWESALILFKIESEVDNREAKAINGLTNKSQKRKRKWKQLENLNYLRTT